jgi:phosphate uptake regulator
MEDPGNVEQANLPLWAAHRLERTADRTINLCERAVLPVAGKMVEPVSDDPGVESIG